MVVNRMLGRFLPPDRRLNPAALAWIVVVIAAIGMLAIESSIAVSVYGAPVALAFGLSLIHVGTMPLSMLRPLFGAILSSFVCAALPLIVSPAIVSHTSGGTWPWMVPALITQVFVVLIIGLRAHWGIALSAVLGSIGGSVLAVVLGRWLLDHRPSESPVINIMIYACVAGGIYVAAVVVQQGQLIRSQLLQEKENTAEEHSKRVTIEERARIARELHDIVAHSMSIINIQASSAPFRHPGVDAEVAKEFEDISTSARTALTEMRGLLSVLRNDEASSELAPQPKLSDVEALVDQARQAGVHVTLERSGEPVEPQLRESTGLAGYRIIQEALSNAIRHARNSDIAIRIRCGGGSVWISVTNTRGDGPTAAAQSESHRGQGLVGMRERAGSVGGEIRSGRTISGGFEVEAVLPLSLTEPTADDRQELT
ncbi:sensor histidine kinase [Brevibacterium spongiae]|uniref:histidine kinase n=1 Tax=Brevibacterium spongiae TaxID=2909672 RepID=A0ABY5SS27_9MICO|nr:histidine kinase [Brevibacterium spongiae]UVI37365.1 histidine kinase [Brevibacterium spongiae]